MSERRYGVWAGDPEGRAEQPRQCIAEVQEPSGWLSFQCGRKRGHGPDDAYCCQHAKMLAAGRPVYVPGAR